MKPVTDLKQVKFVFAIREKCQMTALNGYGTGYLQNIIRTATYCQQGCIMKAEKMGAGKIIMKMET